MVHGGGGGVAVELMPKLLESAGTLDVSERVCLGACRQCEVHIRMALFDVGPTCLILKGNASVTPSTARLCLCTCDLNFFGACACAQGSRGWIDRWMMRFDGMGWDDGMDRK